MPRLTDVLKACEISPPGSEMPWGLYRRSTGKFKKQILQLDPSGGYRFGEWNSRLDGDWEAGRRCSTEKRSYWRLWRRRTWCECPPQGVIWTSTTGNWVHSTSVVNCFVNLTCPVDRIGIGPGRDKSGPKIRACFFPPDKGGAAWSCGSAVQSKGNGLTLRRIEYYPFK